MFISKPEYQAEISALIEILKAAPLGATITYQAMNAVIGRSVQREASFSLIKARKIVEKETGARFGTIYKIGIKRLSAQEIPSIGIDGRRRISSISKRAYARLSNLSNNDITPEIERRIQAEKSHLGAIALVTKEVQHKKIDEYVKTAGAEIPSAKVLGLFLKSD